MNATDVVIQDYPQNHEPISILHCEQVVAKSLSHARVEVHGERGELLVQHYAPGDIIVCRRNTEDNLRWLEPMRALKITLSDVQLRSVAEEQNLLSLDLRDAPLLRNPGMAALIRALESEHRDGFPTGKMFLEGVGLALAGGLLSACATSPLSNANGCSSLSIRQLRAVKECVHEHLEEDLSIHDLARLCDLSASHFSRKFQEATGIPPHQYVVQQRIKRAKNMLRDPRLRVLDVAIACGFKSSQHFARAFRAHTGYTPTLYRFHAS